MTGQEGRDAALLVNTGDGRYARYFAELGRALRMLASWSQDWSNGALIASQHQDYLRGLGACYDMLQSRFTFESSDSLMVDLSNSGYPHSYMLTRIATDRAQALSEHLKGDALGVADLKQVFLDDLFDTGSVNLALLNRIACARYAEVAADMDGTFDPRFMCGSAQPDPAVPKRYRLQWSAFDPTLNLPVLCGMIFEYQGIDLTRALAGLKLVLKYETKAGISIATLAHAIDTASADIRPMVMTRAILGPLHLPGLTDEQGTWEKLPGIRLGSDVVIEITVDHTHAVSSRKPSKLAVSFGVSPSESQVFAIRVTDPLCYERGADAVERIIILPHRMLQSMGAEERKHRASDYVLVPYIKEGELQ